MKHHVTIRVRNLLKISVFVFLFAVGSVLHAQQTGTLTGTVQDPRGAALPGAAVMVKNDSSSLTRSGDDGCAGTLYGVQPAGRQIYGAGDGGGLRGGE